MCVCVCVCVCVHWNPLIRTRTDPLCRIRTHCKSGQVLFVIGVRIMGYSNLIG